MDIAPATPFDATLAPQRQVDGLSWRAGVVAVALAVTWVAVCYSSTVAAMVGIWARSDTFMHGFLIAPISAWLIFRIRGRLALLVPRPSYWALVPTLGAGVAWLIGELAAVNPLSQFAVVAMLVLAVPMTLGWAIARAATFPLAFLFFMVPFGEFLLPPLMEGTANVTVAALRATGVPVYREGLQFVIPSGNWSVVEACSGVRYLIASMVAGSLFAYVTYRSARKRVAFFAVSIVVPIVANWVRAYLIVMLGHVSNNTLAVGVDHLIYGWLFFGVVLVLLFWIGSRWQDHDDPVAGAGTVPRVGVIHGRGLGYALPALIAFAVAVAAAPLVERGLYRTTDAPAPVLVSPRLPDAWTVTAGGLAGWNPRIVGAPAQAHATYARPDATVGVYVGYFRDQRDGRKLISSENVLAASTDTQWTVTGSGIVQTGVPSPGEARESILKRVDGARLVAWQWYWIDGNVTASEIAAKWYALKARLAGRGDDGAIVIVTTLSDTPASAQAVLQPFLRDAAPAIDDALRKTQLRQ